MFSYCIKCLPQIDNAGTIHAQSFDSGAASGRQSDDQRTILVPSEML